MAMRSQELFFYTCERQHGRDTPCANGGAPLSGCFGPFYWMNIPSQGCARFGLIGSGWNEIKC
jgi:hypothetical protein